MLNVVEMKPDLGADSLVTALRNIADDIESCAYDFDPNLAVVVLAQEREIRDRDGVSVSFNWQTHGLGRACRVFTAKGILASALSSFEGGE